MSKFFGKMRNGQTSVETLMIMAIGVFILAALVSMVYEQMNYGYAQQQQNTAELAVRALAKEVDDAYFLGPGTVRSIILPMPEGVDFENSFIDGRAIVLRVSETDHTASTKIDVRGVWPNSTGSFNFVITSFNDFVHVSAAKASFSPASISETVIQSSSKQASVLFSNYSGGEIKYNMAVNFPASGAGAFVSSPDEGEVSLGADENIILGFDISCSADAFGSYSGEVVFEPVLGTETRLSFPVNVFCSSSQKKLGIFPADKNMFAQVSTASSDSMIVCNNSSSDFDSVLVSVSGSISPYVFPEAIGPLPKNSCETIVLNLTPPQSAGAYSGSIIVQSSGLSSSSNAALFVVEELVPSTVIFDWSAASFSIGGDSLDDANVFNNDSNIIVDKVVFVSSNDLNDSNMSSMYFGGVNILPPLTSASSGEWVDVDDFNFAFSDYALLDLVFDGVLNNDSEKLKVGFLSKGGAYYWSGVFDNSLSVVDSAENHFSSAIGAGDFNVEAGSGGLALSSVDGVYSLDGNFYSRTFDLQRVVDFNSISWDASSVGGGDILDTSIQLFARSSVLGSSWSDWQSVGDLSPSALLVPNGRYFEYLAVLGTIDSNISPLLDDVNVSYVNIGS